MKIFVLTLFTSVKLHISKIIETKLLERQKLCKLLYMRALYLFLLQIIKKCLINGLFIELIINLWNGVFSYSAP